MKISYYAIFEYDGKDINISFPDLKGCLSCAWSKEEAFYMAKDALELYICDLPYKKLPKAKSKNEIKLKKNEELYKITADFYVKQDICFVQGVKSNTSKKAVDEYKIYIDSLPDSDEHGIVQEDNN
jgi:predicted RNase H-like HicB family nuclease